MVPEKQNMYVALNYYSQSIINNLYYDLVNDCEDIKMKSISIDVDQISVVGSCKHTDVTDEMDTNTYLTYVFEKIKREVFLTNTHFLAVRQIMTEVSKNTFMTQQVTIVLLNQINFLSLYL